MKGFNEKKFLGLISSVLRWGVILFITFSFAGYIIKPFSFALFKIFVESGVFILIITPVLRIVMLLYSFLRLGEKKYTLYALGVLILLFSSIIMKI